MPFTVQQLVSDLGRPVTADLEDSIHVALDRMLLHDYSQLPVVKGSGQEAQFFLITTDSILTKLHAFGEKLADTQLKVKDALVKVPCALPNDDISEVLQTLRDMPAVLVINEERQLINIVTTYDTTVYFRRWSENMARAQDVENSLKRYINAAFKTADGKIDEAARQVAIDDVTSANKSLRKKFEVALGKYLGEQALDAITLDPTWTGKAFWQLINSTSNSSQVVEAAIEVTEAAKGNALLAAQELKLCFESALLSYLKDRAATEVQVRAAAVDTAFRVLVDPKEKPTDFNELTLWEYTQLFFHPRCWDRCCKVFDKDKATVIFMLEGVRKTRNKLAHFREDEITSQDRSQLRTCAEFLQAQEKAAQALFDRTAPAAEQQPQTPVTREAIATSAEDEVRPPPIE